MIVISHTFETGTVVYGTSRNDSTASIIHQIGFRPSNSLPEHPEHGDAYWYVPSTRRHLAKTDKIDRCAEALREADYDVTVEIDHTTLPTTPFAELEQDRYDRANARADRLDGWAQSASAKGEAMIAQVDEERSHIPLGQPHLIGHHSFNRTVRQEEKRNAKEQRGLEHVRRGRHWAKRAEDAATYQKGREAIRTTINRIDRLEAEVRRLKREMLPREDYWTIWLGGLGYRRQRESFRDRFAQLPVGSKILALDLRRNLAKIQIVRSEGSLAICAALVAMREEEITYWKRHLEETRAAKGIRVWTREDFAVGDFAKVGTRFYEIARRNPKTLTVHNGVNTHQLKIVTSVNARNAAGGPGWKNKITYTEVTGKLTAAEARSQHPDAFQEQSPNPGAPSGSAA
ncbi:DUF3560 domain-containing protein [Actinomadura hibisca]|uniref:DUF3560 domain-containing protein n=1 Tax=Actinomadura hibisca TaxID=68565 RepID=UPI00082ED2E0|nr:DUF3560 domain-containing protein [Actinomadura hibisca]